MSRFDQMRKRLLAYLLLPAVLAMSYAPLLSLSPWLSVQPAVVYAEDQGCPTHRGGKTSPKYDETLKRCVYEPAYDVLKGGPADCDPPYTPIEGGARCAAVSEDDALTPTKPGPLVYPKCAYKNFGPVNCPLNGENINYKSDDCYVSDPTSADKSLRPWRKVACTDESFKRPATVNCDPGLPAEAKQAYCDKAANCTGQGASGVCNLTTQYVSPAIKAAVALVGVGITFAIVVAGIQYASSADDPRRQADARRRIGTAILTLVAFLLFFAFLNWVIPGGIK